MRFSFALVAAANLLAMTTAAPAEAATNAKAGTAAGLEVNTVAGTFKSLDTTAGFGTESTQAPAFCGGLTYAQCSGLCYAYGYRYYQCLSSPNVCRCLKF